MGALTRKKEGKYMKLRFWQRTAEKKDFDIAVWGGQYDQLYVEIESSRTMDPEALKEFYVAIHKLTGWYQHRIYFQQEK